MKIDKKSFWMSYNDNSNIPFLYFFLINKMVILFCINKIIILPYFAAENRNK